MSYKLEFGAKRAPGHLFSIQKADVRSLGVRRRRRRGERQAREGGKGGAQELTGVQGGKQAANKQGLFAAYLPFISTSQGWGQHVRGK